jgi:hypothetical protein
VYKKQIAALEKSLLTESVFDEVYWSKRRVLTKEDLMIKAAELD